MYARQRPIESDVQIRSATPAESNSSSSLDSFGILLFVGCAERRHLRADDDRSLGIARRARALHVPGRGVRSAMPSASATAAVTIQIAGRAAPRHTMNGRIEIATMAADERAANAAGRVAIGERGRRRRDRGRDRGQDDRSDGEAETPLPPRPSGAACHRDGQAPAGPGRAPFFPRRPSPRFVRRRATTRDRAPT